MSSPTSKANNVWEVNGGDDLLQLTGQGGGVLGGISNSGAGYGALAGSPWPLAFPVSNPKILEFTGQATANGQNVFYTVPAGRRAMWVNCYFLNLSGASAILTPFVEIGGTFLILLNGVSANNNANQQIQPAVYIAEAGESFSMDSISSPGQPYNYSNVIFEFDATSNAASAKLSPSNIVAGNNTIFTCPANFKAVLSTPNMPIGLGAFGSVFLVGAAVAVSNETGANRTYSVYLVPNGSSPSSVNQMVVAQVVNLGGINRVLFSTCHVLNPGDSIVVNSDSSVAGQLIWVTYCLIPATD